MNTHAVLRNLTPHQLDIVVEDGTVARLPSEGPAPRVLVDRTNPRTVSTQLGQVTITTTTSSSDATAMPDPKPGVLLVVSRTVADAAPHRTDLLVPDQLVRDRAGRVIAAGSLARLGR